LLLVFPHPRSSPGTAGKGSSDLSRGEVKGRNITILLGFVLWVCFLITLSFARLKAALKVLPVAEKDKKEGR